jgi:hypothetical protein
MSFVATIEFGCLCGRNRQVTLLKTIPQRLDQREALARAKFGDLL